MSRFIWSLITGMTIDYSRGTQIAYHAKTQKNCTREIYD